MTRLAPRIGHLLDRMRLAAGRPLPSPIRENAWFANPEWCLALSHLLGEGYCVVKGAVASDLVDVAVVAYQEFKQRILMNHAASVTAACFEANKFRRLVNLHVAVPALGHLFSANQALPLLDHLFGSPAIPTRP